MTGVAIMAILVAALVGQAAWMATDMLRGGDEETSAGRRLLAYTEIAWESSGGQTQSILRKKRFSRFPILERILRRFNVGASLSRDLRRAGLRWGPGEFLFAQLLMTTVAGFAAFVLLPNVFGGVVPAAAAGGLAFLAPLLWLRHRASGRLAKFEAVLPDALDLVAGSLRAGYSLVDGLALIAREDNGPCSEEFAEVLQEVRIGADLDAALVRMSERVESEDMRLLTTAIAVQRRTGGNLMEVLNQMARTLRERQRLKGDVRVLTTLPRISGYVIGVMPVLMALMMFVTSRKSFDTLITEPMGHAVLAGSSVMVLVGLYLNHRIASVDM